MHSFSFPLYKTFRTLVSFPHCVASNQARADSPEGITVLFFSSPKKVLIFSSNHNTVCKALFTIPNAFWRKHVMHCWKSVDKERHFGYHRVFLLSSIVMMMVFSFIYVPINVLNHRVFYDHHILLFFAGLLSIYPLHKICHALPVLHCARNMTCTLRRQIGILPTVTLRLNVPITKWRYGMALTAPFFVLNSFLMFGCFHFPHYSHYFIMLTAFHTGICLIDFLCVRTLLFSPRRAMIEENEDGYEILIEQ